MSRTFVKSPLEIGNRLLEWFHDPGPRDKVTRAVLLWVNNHFNDFETNADLCQFLEEFEDALEKQVQADWSIDSIPDLYSIGWEFEMKPERSHLSIEVLSNNVSFCHVKDIESCPKIRLIDQFRFPLFVPHINQF